ncbi:hypothetical protein GOP47_0031119, partial [Adiantum capillus-veneris]
QDMSLLVIAWSYDMQRNTSEEYIETPSLDRDIIMFGMGKLQLSRSTQHYLAWEVELSKKMENLQLCGPIDIPGGGGNLIDDFKI